MFFTSLQKALTRPHPARADRARKASRPTLRARRLRHEPLEQRTLLSAGSIGGTVFEDLDADGVQDAGELGLPGWTVLSERTDLLATFYDPTPADGDTFGGQVWPLGDDILIGANSDDMAGAETGTIFLFDGSTYELIRAFPNPYPVEGESGFGGGTLATVGANILASSAHKTINGYTNCGAVYLIDSNTGDVIHTFDNPSPEQDDNFGQKGTADGNLVALSAMGDSTAGAAGAGAVYVFDASTGSLVHTILNPTPEAGEQFGSSLAMAEGKILVGARHDNSGAPSAGTAYLFDASDGSLLQTYLNPTPEAQDLFGVSVALLGDRVLVGARSDDGVQPGGAVYAFDASTGALVHTFENPTPAYGDRFGDGMETMGTNVLINARRDDAGATDAGAVYLFDGSSGQLLQTFLNPTPGGADEAFGSIGVVGDNVIIGAKFKDIGARHAGAAYLFEAVSRTTTDASGNYSFTDLEAGNYEVRELLQPGYAQTALGGDGTHAVTIAGGENVTGRDFGNAGVLTTVYQSTDVPKSLKDRKGRNPGVTRSTLTVADAVDVRDLNVELDISHTYDADLDVFLVAPDGTRVELFSDVGGSDDNFTGTILDDQASTSIIDGSAPFTGTFQPEGSLASLDGKSAQGTWTLEISDDTKGNSGTLNSWSIAVDHLVPEPTSGDTFIATDVPKTIADPNKKGRPRPATSQLSITSTGITLGQIDVDVAISHGAEAGLIVTLTSPGSTETLVFDGADWNVPPGAFDTEALDGLWGLSVTDTNRDGTTGTLDAWSLTATPAGESASAAMAAAVDQLLAEADDDDPIADALAVDLMLMQ